MPKLAQIKTRVYISRIIKMCVMVINKNIFNIPENIVWRSCATGVTDFVFRSATILVSLNQKSL